MTKKHLKLLAEAISKVDSLKERKRLVTLMGEVCQSQNDRFDWFRWNEAYNCPNL